MIVGEPWKQIPAGRLMPGRGRRCLLLPPRTGKGKGIAGPNTQNDAGKYAEQFDETRILV